MHSDLLEAAGQAISVIFGRDDAISVARVVDECHRGRRRVNPMNEAGVLRWTPHRALKFGDEITTPRDAGWLTTRRLALREIFP
jgi:hypothetical protein